MPNVPDKIAKAAAAHRPVRKSPAQIVPGEFVTVDAYDRTDRAVMLIMSVHQDYVDVRLCSNETYQATSLDLVVPGSGAIRPYHLLVQSELFGPVWISQVKDQLGMADPLVMKLLPKMLPDNGVEGDGPPLTSYPHDLRREFKERELERLLPFIGHCRNELLERMTS